MVVLFDSHIKFCIQLITTYKKYREYDKDTRDDDRLRPSNSRQIYIFLANLFTSKKLYDLLIPILNSYHTFIKILFFPDLH